jgi:PAT family beta-lactamase induction signal transducer AmpG
VSLRGKLAVIALVYVIEGYPMAIFRDVWPVYFRHQGVALSTHQGVALSTIGAISGLYVAWSLKVLWSPLIDRFGERRQWIAGALGTMGIALLLLAGRDPDPDALLWAILGAFCFASATQDIAIDAYTIGIVERGEEGPANGVRITAYRIALLVGGGGLVFLPDRIGWPATWFVAAGLFGAMAAGLLLCPRVAVPLEARRETIAPMRRWLGRPGVLFVLLFVLFYRIGDLAIAPMLKPFWVDRQLSLDEIAFVSSILGGIATMVGAVLGGVIVSRLGIGRALVVVGVLALASNLGYALAAAFPTSGRPGVYAASLVESFCGGLAAAGFMSYLMRICEKEHAAVQYAALTSLYALPGTFAGAVSGVAVEQMGYASFFALTALLALPAFAFLPGARGWLGGESLSGAKRHIAQ